MPKLFGASLFLGLQTHQQRLKSTPPPPREGYRSSFPLAKGRSGCSRRPPELGSLLKLAAPSVKEFVMSFSGAGPDYSVGKTTQSCSPSVPPRAPARITERASPQPWTPSPALSAPQLGLGPASSFLSAFSSLCPTNLRSRLESGLHGGALALGYPCM